MLSQWTNFSIQQISVQHLNIWEPTGGSDSKESACNARDLGSIPELGKIPWEGHSYPLQYSCLENSIDRGAWWASVHGSQRIRHDWTPNTFTKYLTNSCVRHWWQWAEHRVCPSGEAGTGQVVLVEVPVSERSEMSAGEKNLRTASWRRWDLSQNPPQAFVNSASPSNLLWRALKTREEELENLLEGFWKPERPAQIS